MTDQQSARTGQFSASGTKARKSTAKVGHNKPPEPIGTTVTIDLMDGTPPIDITNAINGQMSINGDGDDRLRLLVERIERLEEERKGIGDDIKDVYAEAKSTGYDMKTMRRIVRLRKMKPDDRREAEALLATYARSLGLDLQGSLF